MSKEFIIHKKSGTYAETLEAFGVAILLDNICNYSGSLFLTNDEECRRVVNILL